MIRFEPFDWKSEPPAGIPFPPSRELTGLRFLGRCSDYAVADTWYPSWGEDGHLYSPWTDGVTQGVGCSSDSGNKDGPGGTSNPASTAQGRLLGDDPLNLEIEAIGVCENDPSPYAGRYPCGSLVHDGLWYYGTYVLSPKAFTWYGPTMYNWPWLGPFVGFRVSEDLGKTWTETPHTPEKPLFGETGLYGYPVRIGAPHFVDFGRNMEHSPDGKAYLVAHGSEPRLYPARFGNNSWITGDQVYLLRVTPGKETMNDPQAYEFFAGHDRNGEPRWTRQFEEIRPLLEWRDNMGCVTATYNAALRKYLMCVTDGGNTCGPMNTYLLEADALTGPWRLVTYMKHFGNQAYFVNVPSKFISADGLRMWLCYSANYLTREANPPGSRYGLVLQEVELVRGTRQPAGL